MIEKIIITPFQKFTKIESFSGILLFSAAIFALLWANSPWASMYESLWQYKIGINTPNFELNKPLILWVNDGLMALFFFLIGLEIKRELLIGELNSIRKATFPFFAALGGMLIPVALFFLLNKNPETTGGWGIPMATDIAFSLAILNILGKRVLLSLKIFLTAFAIIDDIGAVLVIAIFYSSGINWFLLTLSVVPLIVLSALSVQQIYSKYVVFLLGTVVWLLFLKSGIHPTVAGVLLAFTIPIRQQIDVKTYTRKLSEIIQNIKGAEDNDDPVLTTEQIEQIDDLEDWTGKVQSPLQHLEHMLHNWVAYFIMPVFAFANAGISFSSNMQLDFPLIMIIALSLFIGKLLGISFFSLLGVKLRLADLPGDVNRMQVLGVAMLAGVGFTMSIFIANLAFTENPDFLDSAKAGILLGSLISGTAGYFLLRMGYKK
ncbi:MAG: Na+/H+ antiporter NhaA [Bacteroidetes bacterium GWF2_42_66]|nr:MAG: Na+/H+ antiporter NhaA [Bacteroidetes bacterium GWA2_42_15]OFX97856.1 MAG: Na+/H+ antiporter NhaA [Bacteroidetes bacterium GWE2_42_39]OFY44167.1 MAG: Na+/H+ antiporter NhaA [Bacteroidetes bacterium GWF2_42_66]HBL74585.1 Na+/H+ antiporter NhaA [Prolixibacteraceae bacterium]HCR91525.1 Na+/H+ antiporter NhaA [Prolixibacteraceae bacterium]